MWGAICVDTLALSYLPSTAGYAGASAESLKRRKCQNIMGNKIFDPFGIETLGSRGPIARAFIQLAKQLLYAFRDQKAVFF